MALTLTHTWKCQDHRTKVPSLISNEDIQCAILETKLAHDFYPPTTILFENLGGIVIYASVFNLPVRFVCNTYVNNQALSLNVRANHLVKARHPSKYH